MSGSGSWQLLNQESITNSCWPQLSHLADLSARENLVHIVHLYMHYNNAAFQELEKCKWLILKNTLPKIRIMGKCVRLSMFRMSRMLNHAWWVGKFNGHCHSINLFPWKVWTWGVTKCQFVEIALILWQLIIDRFELFSLSIKTWPYPRSEQFTTTKVNLPTCLFALSSSFLPLPFLLHSYWQLVSVLGIFATT